MKQVGTIPSGMSYVDVTGGSAGRRSLSRMRETVRNAVESQTRAAIVADFGFSEPQPKALTLILKALIKEARPLPVVVDRLAVSDEEVCAILRQIAPKSPVAVKSVRGVTWVGLPDHLPETVMTDMFEQESLTVSAVHELAGGRQAGGRLLRWLAAKHLGKVAEDILFTPIHRRAVDSLVIEMTGEALSEEFHSYGGGKEDGYVFRTPTLELVKRFVLVEELLEKKLGFDRALSGLARKCVLELRNRWGTRAIEIVADAKVSHEILQGFRRHLAAELGRTEDEIGVSQLGPDGVPAQISSYAVIALADIIHTGATIERLLAQIIRAGANPDFISVVTLLDGRSDQRKGVRFQSTEFVTVRLSPVHIEAVEEDPNSNTIIDINPATLQWEKQKHVFSNIYPIDISQMVVNEGAAFFGHIVRPNGRHYCYLIDPVTFLGTDRFRDLTDLTPSGHQLIGKFRKVIGDWVDNGPIDTICFPKTERPHAAETLAYALSAHYRSASVVPIIQRGPNYGLTVRGTTVIVDWSAVSGSTIRDMVRCAIRAGARRILVVVFLSNIPHEEEHLLRNIRRIAGVLGRPGLEADIKIVFLARFAQTAHEPGTCPHCRQLVRLNTEESNLPLPWLNGYVHSLRRKLRPITVAEAVRTAKANDEDKEKRSAQPTSEEILQIADFWEDLTKAQQYTSYRHKLLQQLKAWQGRPQAFSTEIKLFIKLLAIEWPWVKKEPIILPVFKRHIAALAASVAQAADAGEEEIHDAITVLRSVSKHEFARSLPGIFAANIENEKIISHILYCVFTYVQHDYRIPASLKELVKGLKRCAEFAWTWQQENRRPFTAPILLTVNTLLQQGTYGVQRKGLSTLGAWRSLVRTTTEDLKPHAPIVQAMDSLRFGVRDRDPDLLATLDWEAYRQDWEDKVLPFLNRRVLSKLKDIREILTGLDAMARSGEGEFELTQFEDGRGFREIAVLGTQLQVFASSPAMILNPDEWRAFVRARDWVWRMLIDPGDAGSRPRRAGSVLHRLIVGCPTELLDVLEQVARPDYWPGLEIQMDVAPEAEACEVFCHTDILRDCLHELLYNVEKHNSPGQDEERIPVAFLVTAERDQVTVHLRNRGVPNGRTGNQMGLAASVERLRPYEGTITYRSGNPDGDWVFGVTVQLQRWS